MNRLRTLIPACLALCLHACTAAMGAELATLSPATWDEFAPQGKEVDCIYGDLVLRNDQLVAVLARPIPGRNANMMVRRVGGMLIDLTQRKSQSDQLSAFYPGATRLAFDSPEQMTVTVDGMAIGKDQASGKSVVVAFRAIDASSRLPTTTTYSVTDGHPYVAIETTYENPGDEPVTAGLADSLRADRTFKFGADASTRLYWAFDPWFEQAYGIVAQDSEVRRAKEKGVVVEYVQNGAGQIEIPAGQSVTHRRKLIPAAHLLELRGIASKLAGVATTPIAIRVTDPAGPVRRAKVTLNAGDGQYGFARTPASGELKFAIPPGRYDVTVEALGRPTGKAILDTSTTSDLEVPLQACGYVVGQITDEDGGPVPCKVAFYGLEGTATPFFAPDSEAVAVHNLHYSHDGRIRQEIGPGKYEVLISRGPEYDVVVRQVEVVRGKETRLAASLIQSVDTSGWISADFHSHSSPSGDNTSSQFGRVLNLLAEHIEFAPCTEHNRI
ncbi:MAG: hypothetical protein OES79_12115, partial [Planctomycetota bacterium]|nr:hypothetical protein [Planctomycetota bacterium]